MTVTNERSRILMFGDGFSEEPATVVDFSQAVRERLAVQVREIYCVCVREITGDSSYGVRPMPQWDGGENRFGTTRKPVWPKIVDTVIEIEADPVQFIRAQFKFVTNPSRYPAPNKLYNKDAKLCWARYRETIKSTIQGEIESDLNQVTINMVSLVEGLNWTNRQALNYVLRDFTVCTVSPLVRFCLARAAELPIAATFKEHALLQYMFQMTEYDACIQNIPEDFKGEAKALRRKLVGQ